MYQNTEVPYTRSNTPVYFMYQHTEVPYTRYNTPVYISVFDLTGDRTTDLPHWKLTLYHY